MGISFAIPIDEAMRVADQLRTNGRVIRGRIGVVDRRRHQGSGRVDRPGQAGRCAGAQRREGRPGRQGRRRGAATSSPKSTAGRSRRRATCRASSARPSPARKAAAAGVPSRRRPRAGGDGRRVRRRAPRRARAGRSLAAPPATKSALGLAVSGPDRGAEGGAADRGGVRVDSVEGAAAAAGLREGDVHPVDRQHRDRAMRTVRGAAAKAEKARAVSVLVRRGEWKLNYRADPVRAAEGRQIDGEAIRRQVEQNRGVFHIVRGPSIPPGAGWDGAASCLRRTMN